jgi:hypothetical protein
MNEVTLTLNLGEVNQILEALGNQSYVSVFELIAQLRSTNQAENAA